jgi:hypothetical protein
MIKAGGHREMLDAAQGADQGWRRMKEDAGLTQGIGQLPKVLRCIIHCFSCLDRAEIGECGDVSLAWCWHAWCRGRMTAIERAAKVSMSVQRGW